MNQKVAIWNITKEVVVLTATAMFAISNETFSVPKTSSLPSSKVKDIEEESPQRKWSISGNRVIDVHILLVVFLVRCYILDVWVQFSSSFWKIWERTRTIIIVVFKILHHLLQIYSRIIHFSKITEVFKSINKLLTLYDHQLANVMLEFKKLIL